MSITYHDIQGLPAGMAVQNYKGQQVIRLIDGNYFYRRSANVQFIDATKHFGEHNLPDYLNTLGPFKEAGK